MRQSKLFTKTRREAPKDEVSKNAQLLIRAGFVYKEMAGVYAFLPLGLRVMGKIMNIIREEMNAIGSQEITLTALQQKETWEPTNQWDDTQVDVWFKTKLKNDTELGLAVTHEAAMTKMMKDFVSSYRDLPAYIYQFQTKFRNETRAKSGIMRTREFIMKDLYSFSKNESEHAAFYDKAKDAYVNVFKRVGLGDRTFLTFASGGMFSKFSHEFQTITDAGEDIVYINRKNNIAINKEVFTDEVKADLGLDGEFEEAKSVEVGNIFTLGSRFSDALELGYMDEQGQKQKVLMGSYGIGPARVMGTIVETLSDEKGIVWPRSVAPFSVHLILVTGSDEAKTRAEDLYAELTTAGFDVLFDDRDARAGEKFGDSDLIGIPTRVVVSDKNQKTDAGTFLLEVKDRKSGEVSHQSVADLVTSLKNHV